MKCFHRLIAMLLMLTCILSLVSIAAFADEEVTGAQTLTAAVNTVLSKEETEDSYAAPLSEETSEPVPEATADAAEIPEEKSVTDEPVTTEVSEDDTVPEDAVQTDENAANEEAPVTDAESEPTENAEEAEAYHWAEPGSKDAEILGGGAMLTDGDRFYYSQNGIWLEENGGTIYLSGDEGKNLNLAEDWLYYTVSDSIRRLPAEGGAVETVYSADAEIQTLYVMDWEMRFLSGGSIYSYDLRDGTITTHSAPEGTRGFIPTEYGNLYLTGAVLDYSLQTDQDVLLSGVIMAYTEKGWLVVVNSAGTWQVSLPELFEGSCALREYDLYKAEQEAILNNGLTEEEELAKEAAFIQSDEYLELLGGELTVLSVDGLYYTSSNSAIASLASNLSTNQKNIVLRARQMAEVEWTPLYWRYSWGGNDSNYVSNHSFGSRCTATDGSYTMGYFAAGKTYRGVPYSQAVYTAGYVGWDISLSNFVKAVNNSSSRFYSGYSTFSRTAPYYGSDCSGFVSWAWDVSTRRTCTTLLNDSQYIGEYVSMLQVGDCLNDPDSHVTLVTDIGYDKNGNIVAVEITEQTPAKMRVSCYGEQIPGKYYDALYSLSYLQSSYLNGDYSIYRRNISKSVSFQESDAVDLNKGGYAPAPQIAVSVNNAGNAKVVTLTHSNSNAVIYYTTDGSEPTKNSTKYTAPFEVTKDTTIRAIADCGDSYTGSHAVTYSVTVSKAEKPFIALVEGDMDPRGEVAYVSSGTKIAIVTGAMDDVYYTTDGTTPTKNSTKMPMEGITITQAVNIKAVAVSDTDLNSDVVTISIELGTFHTITATNSLGGIISPSGDTGVLDGADYTFTITPDTYYELKDVLVDGVSVGVVTSYTFESVSKDHTISATFAVDLPFEDLTENWYKESVHYCYSQGLFNGTSATEFSPDDPMTRGMFITVLGRYAKAGTDLEKWSGTLGVTNGSFIYIREKTSTSDTSTIKGQTGTTGEHVNVLSKVSANDSIDGATWYNVEYKGEITGYIRETLTGTNPKTLIYVYNGGFTDLPDGAFYTGYAQWGYIQGIVKGYSSTTYGPYYSITREDICVLLYRYLTEYMSYDLATTSDKFVDDSYISDYAAEAVYAMKNIGVVNGYEDGRFYPYLNASRAEVACMFANLYEYMYGTNF